MQPPTLFRDRPRVFQIILGGVVPLTFGAVVGVVVGVSSGAYWALAALAGIGGVLAGLEHQDGWGGADRGLVGGATRPPFGEQVALAAPRGALGSEAAGPPAAGLLAARLVALDRHDGREARGSAGRVRGHAELARDPGAQTGAQSFAPQDWPGEPASDQAARRRATAAAAPSVPAVARPVSASERREGRRWRRYHLPPRQTA